MVSEPIKIKNSSAIRSHARKLKTTGETENQQFVVQLHVSCIEIKSMKNNTLQYKSIKIGNNLLISLIIILLLYEFKKFCQSVIFLLNIFQP